jgi:hypothetical protein
MDPDTIFDDIAADLAAVGVTTGKMFGTRALKLGTKAIGCLRQNGAMTFKLGAANAAHAEALALSGAELFDPSGMGRPFKDWVEVPATHSDQWLRLSEAALDFVNSGG